MLVCIGLAVAVLAVVAVPRVREGEKILTPDGELALRDARRRARALASEAKERAEDLADDLKDRADDLKDKATSPRSAQEEPRDRIAADVEARSAEEPAAQEKPAEEKAAAGKPAAESPAAEAPDPEPAATGPVPEPVAVAAPTAGQQAQQTVIDLRERVAADPDPAAAQRDRTARRLEWGDPEPGPRHRR